MPVAALLALSSRKILSVRPIARLRVFSDRNVETIKMIKEGKLFLLTKVS
jgi:hypothetical protein